MISGANDQLGNPEVRTSNPFPRTGVVDDLSEEASHMNEVVISLMCSSLLICVSQEVLDLLFILVMLAGGNNWPEI